MYFFKLESPIPVFVAYSHYAKQYDTNSNSKNYLDRLITLIGMNFLMKCIKNHLFIDPENFVFEKNELLPRPGIHTGILYLFVPDIKEAYLLGIVRALADTKQQIKEKEEVKSHTSEARCYRDE